MASIITLRSVEGAEVFETELGKRWDIPRRKGDNRIAVKSFKESVFIDGDKYPINDNFQQDVLTFSDEVELEVELKVELEELESTRCLLESQEDRGTPGRSHLDCAINRFRQPRPSGER
ncbi:hypothetical protein V3481_007132 [Fusarium oxysporum f. sp. vasinfectum]